MQVVSEVEDKVIERLAASVQRSGAWLRWRLSGPAGEGVIVDGQAALARARTAEGREVWQQIVAPRGRSAALARSLDAVVGDVPLLAIGARPRGLGWTPLATLPSWATGPDPFEPLQPWLTEPGARHDAFAERLAAGGRAVVETWSGRTPRVRADRSMARGADWLAWQLQSDDLVCMEFVDGAQCRGWILVRDDKVLGVRALRIVDLQAEDRVAHYALLKASRQLSWQRGGAPVVLHGERMSRRYAFTAGFLPAGASWRGEALTVWARGSAPEGVWRAWSADV